MQPNLENGSGSWDSESRTKRLVAQPFSDASHYQALHRDVQQELARYRDVYHVCKVVWTTGSMFLRVVDKSARSCISCRYECPPNSAR
eukprot:1126740-Amphidinium_carterae.1